MRHDCIDCQNDPPATVRKIATGPGEPQRCTTHLRRFQTRQRQLARASHVERTYEISAPDAGALLVYQGGKCAICGVATGANKILAVEHDHADDWVRGRCCSTCNQFLTRQLGDDPAKAENLVRYLSGDTPYRRMLAERLIKDRYTDDPVTVTRIEVLPASGSLVAWYQKPDDTLWYRVVVTADELKQYAAPKH